MGLILVSSICINQAHAAISLNLESSDLSYEGGNMSPSTLALRKETCKMILFCCHLGWGQISHSQPHWSVSGQVSHLQFWGTSRCSGFLDDYLPQLGQFLLASSTPISIRRDGKSSDLFQLEGLHESPLLCSLPHSCILLSLPVFSLLRSGTCFY